MCHLLSGVINKSGTKMYFGLLNSHSGIEEAHSLKPDSCREFEWTKDDNGESLVVRVSELDRHDEEWYKEKILSKYATRKDLLKYISTIVCKSSKNSEIRYNEKGNKIFYDSWHENGQKCVERRYNEEGKEISYDSWHENGQKCVEIRYNKEGTIISWNSWHENGQKCVEIRYNEEGKEISSKYWNSNGVEIK